jgi:hypothetical protein
MQNAKCQMPNAEYRVFPHLAFGVRHLAFLIQHPADALAGDANAEGDGGQLTPSRRRRRFGEHVCEPVALHIQCESERGDVLGLLVKTRVELSDRRHGWGLRH